MRFIVNLLSMSIIVVKFLVACPGSICKVEATEDSMLPLIKSYISGISCWNEDCSNIRKDRIAKSLICPSELQNEISEVLTKQLPFQGMTSILKMITPDYNPVLSVSDYLKQLDILKEEDFNKSQNTNNYESVISEITKTKFLENSSPSSSLIPPRLLSGVNSANNFLQLFSKKVKMIESSRLKTKENIKNLFNQKLEEKARQLITNEILMHEKNKIIIKGLATRIYRVSKIEELDVLTEISSLLSIVSLLNKSVDLEFVKLEIKNILLTIFKENKISQKSVLLYFIFLVKSDALEKADNNFCESYRWPAVKWLSVIDKTPENKYYMNKILSSFRTSMTGRRFLESINYKDKATDEVYSQLQNLECNSLNTYFQKIINPAWQLLNSYSQSDILEYELLHYSREFFLNELCRIEYEISKNPLKLIKTFNESTLRINQHITDLKDRFLVTSNQQESQKLLTGLRGIAKLNNQSIACNFII